jgi:hypothetical protein
VVPPSNAGVVYLSTLYAAAALIDAFGGRLQIVKSLDDLIKSQKLRAVPG